MIFCTYLPVPHTAVTKYTPGGACSVNSVSLLVATASVSTTSPTILVIATCTVSFTAVEIFRLNTPPTAGLGQTRNTSSPLERLGEAIPVVFAHPSICTYRTRPL